MNRTLGIVVTAILLLVRCDRAFAQRNLTSTPDPDPEIERKSFVVADGFEVNLFAADPMLAKPIQMNWDAAGRLWVASSEVYPQIEPGQKANDKILILEDTDGDGRADKTTVFADGLLIPTGVEPDRASPNASSAFVANSTELLHLTDTDGDGKADVSRIVLSGFGTEDTHHILHTLRWGEDGCLYFNQSIYIHSHIETPWGVRRLGGGGIWQFRPESWQLEVFCRGFVNPWGHHVDQWGQSFATDGAYGEGINYVFPGSIFVTAPGAVRIMKGLNPGSPKHCGLEIADSGHLPDDWRGNMLTNDFRGNRVCRFVVTEDGSGYASREQPELIKTSHVAFRPIDIKMGPDGAIYIADWYNPIIQHGEVDFRDPRRDHTRGRIWRVTARDRPLVERPKLLDASTEALLESLRSTESWTRHFAKRLLKERGAATVQPALARWVSRLDASDPLVERHRLEALWTYQALDIPADALLKQLLVAKDGRVRAAAMRVFSQWWPRLLATGLAKATETMSAGIADDHPRVRLEAVRALGQVATPESAAIAARTLDKPMDQFLDYALWLTVRELESQWLPGLLAATRSSEMGFSGNVRHQLFALDAIGTPDIVKPLVTLLQEGAIPPDKQEAALTQIGSLGNPGELAMVFDLAVARREEATTRRDVLLAALIRATQRRSQVKPDGDLGQLERLFGPEFDEPMRALAIQAAGLWKVAPLRAALAALANDRNALLRQSAMDSLAQLGDAESLAMLRSRASDTQPIGVRLAAASALTAYQAAEASATSARVLADCDDATDAAELFKRVLERKEGPKALAAALAGLKVPVDVAKTGIRLAQISGREHGELVAALTTAGGVGAGPTKLAPDEMNRMVQEVIERGDPARGESVFRRSDINCMKCHSIAGAGGQAGPDLISIGASAPVDYLIDSLLDPNKQVKEGFHSIVVATTDGRVLTGLRVRQTPAELVLRNADDQEFSIPLNKIEEQKNGGSIMPSGLTDRLTHSELIDLVRFLSLLGKSDGPYAVSPVRVARRWQLPDTAAPAIQEAHAAGLDSIVTAPRVPWNPAYSNVAGDLPFESLTAAQIPNQAGPVALARCQFDVSTPGKIALALNSTTGLGTWFDGKPVPTKDKMEFEVASGRHTLTFAIHLDQRRQSLRCELIELSKPGAQAQFVTRD